MGLINWDELTAKFIKVRDALNKPETSYAYRMAFKQPWKFYREHTAEEAFQILTETYKN
jgi:hypothetical protein